MAKLFAARAANNIADRAVQAFGGYGFLEETRVAMQYRDARILRIGGGTDERQLEILAKRMGVG
jgi:alkylation response protein AidB-like acyl-CoA dehydrogenase